MNRDKINLISRIIEHVGKADTLSYLRLSNLLAADFGRDLAQRETLRAYTALVKSGAVVTSTTFQGEPAVGPATELRLADDLRGYLNSGSAT